LRAFEDSSYPKLCYYMCSCKSFVGEIRASFSLEKSSQRCRGFFSTRILTFEKNFYGDFFEMIADQLTYSRLDFRYSSMKDNNCLNRIFTTIFSAHVSLRLFTLVVIRHTRFVVFSCLKGPSPHAFRPHFHVVG